MDAVWRNVDGIFLGPFLDISRDFGFEVGGTKSRWKSQIVYSKKALEPQPNHTTNPQSIIS
jgi:hypothetical protein